MLGSQYSLGLGSLESLGSLRSLKFWVRTLDLALITGVPEVAGLSVSLGMGLESLGSLGSLGSLRSLRSWVRTLDLALITGSLRSLGQVCGS